MRPFFRIHSLPASCGDCLWIEYGDAASSRRMLIDGGKIGSYPNLQKQVAALSPLDNKIDLLMVTHVDADHIEGIIALLTDATLQLNIGEVWFNGWEQIRRVRDTLGPLQGEFLSALLERSWSSRWNYYWRQFDPSGPIYLRPEETPQSHSFRSMTLTLLSPDEEHLTALARSWQREVTAKKLTPGDFDRALELLRTRHQRLTRGLVLGEADDSWAVLTNVEFHEDEAVNNGSSLAFLADFRGLRCLFLGDAYPSVVRAAIEKCAASHECERLSVGLTKVSHHGSRNNTDEALLHSIDCKHFLFSTDGSTYGHPDEECVARIVEVCGPDVHLYFNHDHRSRRSLWDDKALQQQKRFEVHYPLDGVPGILIPVNT